MTHLKVELNGIGVGVLPNQTVSKLYLIAQSGELDATSNLKGGIYVTNCKESQKQYLENLYPDFSIMCTGEYYIDFVDPVMEQICATTWGDGIGLTRAQAASVTLFGDTFKHNVDITSFDELLYFTGVTSFNYTYDENVFTGCTNLTTVDLRNINRNIPTVSSWFVSMYCKTLFKDCSSLKTVKNYNVNWISSDMFNGCSNLQTINLSNVEYIYDRGFLGCTKLDVTANGLNFNKIKELGSFTLTSCLGVGDVELPLCTSLGLAFNECESITSISNCPNITSLPDSGNRWNPTYKMWDCLFMSQSILSIDFSLSSFTTVPLIVYKCTNLRIVKFPSTVTLVNVYMIRQCPNLEALVISSTTPPTVDFSNHPEYLFLGGTGETNKDLKIYVPDESVSLYKAEAGWNYWKDNIFPMSLFATDFPNG